MFFGYAYFWRNVQNPKKYYLIHVLLRHTNAGTCIHHKPNNLLAIHSHKVVIRHSLSFFFFKSKRLLQIHDHNYRGCSCFQTRLFWGQDYDTQKFAVAPNQILKPFQNVFIFFSIMLQICGFEILSILVQFYQVFDLPFFMTSHYLEQPLRFEKKKR